MRVCMFCFRLEFFKCLLHLFASWLFTTVQWLQTPEVNLVKTRTKTYKHTHLRIFLHIRKQIYKLVYTHLRIRLHATFTITTTKYLFIYFNLFYLLSTVHCFNRQIIFMFVCSFCYCNVYLLDKDKVEKGPWNTKRN